MVKTIFIIVNKNWEVEPVLNALTCAEFRPKALPYPSQVSSPRRDLTQDATPRAVYLLPSSEDARVQVVVWCLQDAMSQDFSSSEEKWRVLPNLYRGYDPPMLVVAVGTAASTVRDRSINGSVVLGGRFFLHDARSADPATSSHLEVKETDQVLEGGVSLNVFEGLAAQFRQANTSARMLPVVNLPSPDPDLPASALPQVFIDGTSIALGTLNVTHYETYPAADRSTLAAFTLAAGEQGHAAATVETTNGLIRLSASVPMLFVSGIANRVLAYAQEATAPHRYVAAFNAGVVLGDMMVALAADGIAW